MATVEELKASIATATATGKQLKKEIKELEGPPVPPVGDTTEVALTAKLTAIEAKNTNLQVRKTALEEEK